jgi:hypothetical protein
LLQKVKLEFPTSSYISSGSQKSVVPFLSHVCITFIFTRPEYERWGYGA